MRELSSSSAIPRTWPFDVKSEEIHANDFSSRPHKLLLGNETALQSFIYDTFYNLYATEAIHHPRDLNYVTQVI